MNLKQNHSYKDARGEIRMVLETCKVGSISVITSEPGSVRAKHWHKNDGHWILITKGQIDYYESKLKGQSRDVKMIVLKEGDIYFTGPHIKHEMHFPEYTEFYCFSLLNRDSEGYENETVRFDESLRTAYEGALYVCG